jgi:modulator of FtsH protease
MNQQYVSTASQSGALAINKLIRNTYTLLSLTLLFSAFTAAVSVMLRMPPMTYLLSIGAAFLLMWFVLPKTANSTTGLWVVFGITGLLGFSLGPILMQYLALSNGPTIVATALAGTGVMFLGLSGYALVSRKDFSFMGGFIFIGMLVMIVAMLANLFLAIPALSLAISAGIILIMSGFILFQTSQMIHNPEQANYIHMTVSLYMAIFNIFISLLQLLGFASND